LKSIQEKPTQLFILSQICNNISLNLSFDDYFSNAFMGTCFSFLAIQAINSARFNGSYK